MNTIKIISQLPAYRYRNENKILKAKNRKPGMGNNLMELVWHENDFIAVTRNAMGLFKVDKYSLEVELIFCSGSNEQIVLGRFNSLEAAKAEIQSVWNDYLKED